MLLEGQQLCTVSDATCALAWEVVLFLLAWLLYALTAYWMRCWAYGWDCVGVSLFLYPDGAGEVVDLTLLGAGGVCCEEVDEEARSYVISSSRHRYLWLIYVQVAGKAGSVVELEDRCRHSWI